MPKTATPSAKPKQTTETDHSIGNRIALLRSASGISQTMLADALGISFQQVQKYEAGKNRIGAGRLRAIADRLGVPVSVFFAEDPGSEAPVSGLDMLQESGALSLLQAYETISDEDMRREILNLVKAAARISQRTRLTDDGL
ncbi:helix-turn-helix domain-containing protein [Methylobacterium gregans]|uniref:HTH cro/C1-type domain-containing protein n=1 Tax=Methylobacterium gregans TaxID=374424 RepID=A0AA37MDU8_9HYPH|nr:helix-turn-helix domain-containing protein [Methylobacterium gregans]MDQ0520155.1 transcriptional regulator with XRE-family HTH domain [Methylobacterium gregans]GJD80446.1 hypothetical protein NBEOAGPD_3687 [Methylobacterium gregans]GLS52558.1 transcriptional regulator [Methylobacterium gregans]